MNLKKIREEERKQEIEQRKQNMVDAAFTCFCTQGIGQTSMTEIARAAGYGEATLYRHFETKENLALECGKKFWSMGKEFFDQKVATPDFNDKNGMEQVEWLVQGAVEFFEQETEAFRLIHNLDEYLLSRKIDPVILQEYEQAIDLLRPCLWDAIEKGKADGSITTTEATLDLYFALTNGIFSMMQKQATAGTLLGTDNAVKPQRKIELFVAILMAGLKHL